ncbi:MAG: formamidopyrimidine-DNA glycosylase [Gemmatimonadaceae bacterium]|nr:formamidopyrimidine-DNA glycosylase [Gemmatimonadaceae bacterium]
MPELPDITVYQDALTRRVVGHTLLQLHVANPFVLRSVEPPLASFVGRPVTGIERLGKRLVLVFDDRSSADAQFLVVHLMIAGRLRWLAPGKKAPAKLGLATFVFEHGSVVLTEAGSKRRASLTAVVGRSALAAMDRGGLDVLASSDDALIARLRSENHTLKRALTDPRLFDGIGNAYSDEILHAAQLSPLMLTSRLDNDTAARLIGAIRSTLTKWITLLRDEVGDGWPETVTAFRPEMAVHGRFELPCPVCAAPVQRIRYADNETNYCARCQTNGVRLADRAMSRLLKSDWPRSLDEL